MSEINETVLAPIIAAGGAITVKIIEKILDRKVKNASTAWDKVRLELKKENDRLLDENLKLRKEVEKWRAKLVRELENEVDGLRQHIDELNSDSSDERE